MVVVLLLIQYRIYLKVWRVQTSGRFCIVMSVRVVVLGLVALAGLAATAAAAEQALEADAKVQRFEDYTSAATLRLCGVLIFCYRATI